MVVRLMKSEETREPARISLALCLGMVTGFLPLLNPINLIVLLLVSVIRVSVLAYIAGLVLFSLLALPLEPLFHRVGLAVLAAPQLAEFWTSLYNSIFWRFQNFNNSVVMGGMIAAIILFLPLLLLANRMLRDAGHAFFRR